MMGERECFQGGFWPQNTRVQRLLMAHIDLYITVESFWCSISGRVGVGGGWCLGGNCRFVVGRSNSRGSSFRGRDSSRRRKEWKPVPDDVAPGENPKQQQEEEEGEEKEPQEQHQDVDSSAAVSGSVSANSNRNNGEEDHDGRGEEEEENAVDDACESLGTRKPNKAQGDGVEEDEDEVKKTRVAHTINLFRIGQVQVCVSIVFL